MRSIIIAVTSTLFVTSAFTQQASQGNALIPDLSGTWSHPYVPGFEPPLSGPGPVINKLRRKQVFDIDGRLIAPGTDAPLASNTFRYVGDYTNSILKPWAAETVRKYGEVESSGLASPKPSDQCWPEPIPYIFWNLGMQLLQQPDRITIIYFDDNQVRRVRMNQPHPAKVTPSWYGDSVGHYDGDALVIDTVGVKTDRPFPVVDWYGTPYTQLLHVVERYRLIDYEATKDTLQQAYKENFRIPANNDTSLVIDPTDKSKGLHLQFTVEDEGAFTTPWRATVTYRRPSATGWPEYICAENLRGTYAGQDGVVPPRADKPDF